MIEKLEKVPYFSEILTPNFVGDPDVTIQNVNKDASEFDQIHINSCILSSTSPFLKKCLTTSSSIYNFKIFVDVKPNTLQYLADFANRGELNFNPKEPGNLVYVVDFMSLGINLFEIEYSSYNEAYKNEEEMLQNFEYPFDDLMESDMKEIYPTDDTFSVINPTDINRNNDLFEENDKSKMNVWNKGVMMGTKRQGVRKLVEEYDPETKKVKMIYVDEYPPLPPMDEKMGTLFDNLSGLDENIEMEEKVEDVKNELENIEPSSAENEPSEPPFKYVKMAKKPDLSCERRVRKVERLQRLGLDVDVFLPPNGGNAFSAHRKEAKDTWNTFQVTEENGMNGKFKCIQCYFRCNERDHFIQHKLRHENIHLMKERGFTHFCTASRECTQKGKVFHSAQELKEHYNEHVKKKTFCKVCDKFVASRYFIAHEDSGHRTQAEIRGGKFEKPGRKSLDWICIHCGYNEDGKKTITQINNHKTKKGPFHDDKCEYENCDTTFISWGEKKMHIKEVHNGAQKFKCSKCGEVFKLAYYCNVHMNSHLEKIEPCDQCESSFPSKQGLQQHVKKHHSSNREVTCETCGKIWKDKQSLHGHIQRDHSEKKPCDACGRLVSAPLMNEHKQRHDESKKPWECSECPKKFWLEKALNEHKNVHTGERPFACDLCKKTYTNNSNLAQHRKSTHFGIKRVFKSKEGPKLEIQN